VSNTALAAFATLRKQMAMAVIDQRRPEFVALTRPAPLAELIGCTGGAVNRFVASGCTLDRFEAKASQALSAGVPDRQRRARPTG
jgi:hypothetical protein